ncbi:MAG: organomercurial lyase [Gammaproteobacteria bacterium]|nr:organomercurial lyase [Gammaproteobacteria bacterium]MDH3374899.1 organomercurial lyase [Gammaproteobacteria bacterium]MDH3409963.1 organomercurial lyase [Gammaproteobacteria bacterium]
MKHSTRPFDATIRCLANRWSGAGLLLPGFPLLARGEPVTVGEIAKAAGVDDRTVATALREARCTLNESGCLIDLFGMMLAPSYHRLEIDRKVVFSCCALWAHVIPKLVDRVVLIESVDPESREMVRLEVTPKKIQSVNPGTALATMTVADAVSIEQDVGSAFCRHVRHFASSDSAHKFAARFPSCRVVEVDQLHEIAAQLYEAILESLSDRPNRHSCE